MDTPRRACLLSLTIFTGVIPTMTLAADPTADAIKAYCIDFNWGEGGPNGFARPGLWADADPARHVAWYKAPAPMSCRRSASRATGTPGTRTASCRNNPA